MAGSLVDVNEMLIEQMRRLSNDNIGAEELDREVKRGEALSKIGQVAVNNANLALRGQQWVEDRVDKSVGLPKMFENQPKMIEVGGDENDK